MYIYIIHIYNCFGFGLRDLYRLKKNNIIYYYIHIIVIDYSSWPSFGRLRFDQIRHDAKANACGKTHTAPQVPRGPIRQSWVLNPQFRSRKGLQKL